jgi:hypothetical protein
MNHPRGSIFLDLLIGTKDCAYGKYVFSAAIPGKTFSCFSIALEKIRTGMEES